MWVLFWANAMAILLEECKNLGSTWQLALRAFCDYLRNRAKLLRFLSLAGVYLSVIAEAIEKFSGDSVSRMASAISGQAARRLPNASSAFARASVAMTSASLGPAICMYSASS